MGRKRNKETGSYSDSLALNAEREKRSLYLEARNLSQDIMQLCKQVAGTLGLPPIAVNPLVAKAFASSLAADKNLNFSLTEGSNR